MRPRLLFVYLQPTSFVMDDVALLRERYEVQPFPFEAARYRGARRRAFGMTRLALKQAAWLLREAPRAEIIVGWFADYHMVLPTLVGRLLGKPVVLMLGGFEAYRMPELGYGVFESRWRAPLARYVLRRASLLLPVAEALMRSSGRYATWPEPRPQGVEAFVPELATPYAVLYFGFAPEHWPMGPEERGPTACTVGQFTSMQTVLRKGLDFLFEAARSMPEMSFQVIGMDGVMEEAVRARFRPPDNVAFLPPQPREALPALYGDASVYLQLSRAEGQPNVLCEAMACGCIPVGSAVAGIPDTIGDAGVVVKTPRTEEIAAAIRRALAMAPEGRQAARQRIVEHFPRERRRRELFRHLDEVIAASKRR